MSNFDAMLVIFGGIFCALLVMFIGIPAVVGSIEWWTEFLRKVYKVGKRRGDPKDSIGE